MKGLRRYPSLDLLSLSLSLSLSVCLSLCLSISRRRTDLLPAEQQDTCFRLRGPRARSRHRRLRRTVAAAAAAAAAMGTVWHCGRQNAARP